MSLPNGKNGLQTLAAAVPVRFSRCVYANGKCSNPGASLALPLCLEHRGQFLESGEFRRWEASQGPDEGSRAMRALLDWCDRVWREERFAEMGEQEKKGGAK